MVGADLGYDRHDFDRDLCGSGGTPLVARNARWLRSARTNGRLPASSNRSHFDSPRMNCESSHQSSPSGGSTSIRAEHACSRLQVLLHRFNGNVNSKVLDFRKFGGLLD